MSSFVRAASNGNDSQPWTQSPEPEVVGCIKLQKAMQGPSSLVLNELGLTEANPHHITIDYPSGDEARLRRAQGSTPGRIDT